MNSEQITELRNNCLQELETKGLDSIHPKDLERVKTDDKWLQKFLLQHDNSAPDALKMLMETVYWRKEFTVNDVAENVKMEIVVAGGFFPHGHDKDGCTLLVFKCKKYVKGQYNMEDLKRSVVYWIERMDRESKGKPITLFFDMENCGLTNMDLDFTRYLINLFKLYYPRSLNYILIFEMPWILNAAFKIVKSWLPEKAVQIIKFLSKKDINDYVPLDQALICWGGENDYSFSFLPESQQIPDGASTPLVLNRKVHFADVSSMSDSPEGGGDKDHGNKGRFDPISNSEGVKNEFLDDVLSVQPSSVIHFVKEGGELVSTLELHNTDTDIILSFKLKTTSPEKFRVRPSVGCLTPGAKATVHVSLLPGFQLGGLSRDKFLVMSTVIDANEAKEDLAHLWKDTSGRKVNQHRLKCAQNDFAKNGSAVQVTVAPESETNQILSKIGGLSECQKQLHESVKRVQHLQVVTLLLVLVLGVLISYVVHLAKEQSLSGSCSAP